MQGFNVEKGHFAAYQRAFSIPQAWKNKRIKLRCNGIYSESEIFINGNKVGAHLGGFTAFELDITKYITMDKANAIAVSVRSESLADSLASGTQYAVHPLGGITRDIYLFPVEEINLSMFHLSTQFDSLFTNSVLKAEVQISNESQQNGKNLSLLFELRDKEGNSIKLDKQEFSVKNINSGENLNQDISFNISNPVKWDCEHPYLYTLNCKLMEKGKVLHETQRYVGFRQIDVKGNQVYVNNKPIKLHGVCRHEVMPLRGRSLTGDIWEKDVELFKKGNVNYIRTSHYPPDETLLDVCDKLGMFVEVEAPFCWAHNTKVPEDKFDAALKNQHIEMVNLNRSHPSIIMWSLGNESNLFTEYFKPAADIIKKIDPTRPRIFSQWGPDADNGELEITNHHYPGPTGPEKYANSKRPVTFDEFCHLNAYNRKELAADPGLRNMWGPLLDRMWTDMYHSKGVLGGAIWAGIDDTFFLPGDKAVGYGTWGPIDGWRREKPEYWGMKKAFSPVRLTLKENIDQNGNLKFHVENRYDFSDLSECTIVWNINNKKGEVKESLPPRSEKEFTIQLPENLRQSENIHLSIIGSQGFIVDEYSYPLLPEQSVLKLVKLSKKVLYKDLSSTIEIDFQGNTYSVDKSNGLISARQKGKALFLNSPSLMILPLNGDGEGIQMTGKDQKFIPYNPTCKNWIAKSVHVESADTGVKVFVSGGYEEAIGEFVYEFSSSGEMTIHYDFRVLKEVQPRQIGLVFSLPETFTELEWSRRGYWNSYPNDHIGALAGKAIAFNKDLPIVGVAGPSMNPENSWPLDQTASGSNMFRSTKENIYKVSLNEPTGNKISVLSDGWQHSRSWLDDHVIKLLIADYNNAGKERFLTPHAEKGYKDLKEGDRITGQIKIEIDQ